MNKLKSNIQKQFYKSMIQNIPEDVIFDYVIENMYDQVREAVFENEQESNYE